MVLILPEHESLTASALNEFLGLEYKRGVGDVGVFRHQFLNSLRRHRVAANQAEVLQGATGGGEGSDAAIGHRLAPPDVQVPQRLGVAPNLCQDYKVWNNYLTRYFICSTHVKYMLNMCVNTNIS